jgi:hypothetical protein
MSHRMERIANLSCGKGILLRSMADSSASSADVTMVTFETPARLFLYASYTQSLQPWLQEHGAAFRRHVVSDAQS